MRRLYSIDATAVALTAFWPKVGIEIVSRDDRVFWLYLVRNDSLLLPITDVTKDQEASLNWSYRYKWEEGTYTPPTTADCADKNSIPILRAGDEHTFKCFVPQFDPPDFMTGGRIKIRVNYRYLKFVPLSKTACFEYEPTRDWKPRWIRRGCP